MAKVNASQIRAGNVIILNDKLFVVLKAQNVQPGKGAAVTQLEMRGVVDGVKTNERFRTTESVERAFIDEQDYQFLFQEGDMYTFMDSETFEQVTVEGEVIGEPKVFLQEGMQVRLSLYEGKPVAAQMPQTVTLEVLETEPVVKGQTASSSYKPSLCDNGIRVMVPPHIGVGTRIVVYTADATYMERAKD